MNEKSSQALVKLLHEFDCSLCHKFLVSPITTDCLHTFCSSCLETHLHTVERACPTCARPQTFNSTTKQHIVFSSLISKAFALCQQFSALTEPTGEVTISQVLPATMDHNNVLSILTSQRLQQEQNVVLNQQHALSSGSQSTTPLSQVLVLSGGLSRFRNRQVRDLLLRFGWTLFDSNADASSPLVPTHLIVDATLQKDGDYRCSPTFKYYWALSKGLWIVRAEWVDACLEHEQVMAEPAFQVRAFSCVFDLQTPPCIPLLFQGLKFCLGRFDTDNSLTREQAKELIELNGGIIEEETSSTVYLLVGHPLHAKHANGECTFCTQTLDSSLNPDIQLIEVSWIIQCLNQLKVVEYRDRVLTL